MKKVILIISLLYFLTGCTPYQPPVQQGNIISPEKMARLKVGMPEFQVRTILGDPVLVNTFSDNDLTYVYSYKSTEKNEIQKVILTFKGKQLVKISR